MADVSSDSQRTRRGPGVGDTGNSPVETPAPGSQRGFSVADLCRRWKVGPDKVHAFIRRGELVAVNVAINLSGRPQWRITPEAVEQFERRRSSGPPPKPPTNHRRRTGQIDYYAD